MAALVTWATACVGTYPDLSYQDRTADTVTAMHILTRTEAAAQHCKNELQGLTELALVSTFSVLAKEYSSCPTKQTGGHMGTFSRGQFKMEFENIAFATPVGKVRGPFQTSHGWHLLLVTERAKPGIPAEVMPGQAGDHGSQADGKGGRSGTGFVHRRARRPGLPDL